MTGIGKFFDDERHRQSEKHAFCAERAEREGKLDEARAAYGEAAKLEEDVARSVPGGEARIRTLLAISAVSLWLKARLWGEATRAGCFFLADPAALTPDGCTELEALVDRAWRSQS